MAEGRFVGRSVPRVEDPKLLTGSTRFIDDLSLPGMLHCAILRSPHAHARVVSVDASDALSLPGVAAVVSGEDALRWLGQYGNPFALIVQDLDGTAALDWGIYGAPETFVIDAKGIVRFKHIGPLTPEIVETSIRPIMQESP